MSDLTPSIDTIPEEMHQKWHDFIDAVNAAMDAVFNVEEEHPVIVLGAQWGEMGHADSGLPVCVVTSNLPVCLVGQALEDMMEQAEADHDRHHGGLGLREDGTPAGFDVSADEVPEAVREAAYRIAEEMGLGRDAVVFRATPDIRDLENPQEALNIPLPEDPGTVEGTDAD